MATDRRQLIRSAERLVSRGKLNAAIGEYLRVLESHPNDTSTLNRVGDLLARLKRLDEAIELFRRAASHFSEQGFFEKAIAIFKKILRFDPHQRQVAENLADLQARHGLISEARRHYKGLVEGYLRDDALGPATVVLRKMADLEPQDPSHRLRLAQVLIRRERIPDAMSQYYAIAELLLSHGKAEEAVRVCREGLELDPEDLNFVSSVVDELRRAGCEAESELFLQAAIEKNPEASRITSPAEEPPAAPEEEAAEVEPGSLSEELLEVVGAEQETVEHVETAPKAPAAIESEEEPAVYDLEVETEPEAEFEIELGDLVPQAVAPQAAAPEIADQPVAEPSAPISDETAVEDEHLKELLIEADVLARYGLEDKAILKLEEIIELAPTHLDAHRRLVMLYLEGTQLEAASTVAGVVRQLAEEQHRPDEWESLQEQLVDEGFRIEEDRLLPPEPVSEPVTEPLEAVTEPAPVVVPEEAVADDLSWLEEVASADAVGDAESPGVFEDEEQFFDLASELERELGEEEGLLADELIIAPEEQSLEEIVEGFRKGMAETLSSEDYDTHYNLGIAYREMGLVDEAISEFQLAAKDPRYLVDCCSLLASCFMEKGFPELAIKWFEEGLSSPTITEEESLGLVYELGDLYLAIGETDEARRRFVEIYGVNSDYRDVGSKLAQLNQV